MTRAEHLRKSAAAAENLNAAMQEMAACVARMRAALDSLRPILVEAVYEEAGEPLGSANIYPQAAEVYAAFGTETTRN